MENSLNKKLRIQMGHIVPGLTHNAYFDRSFVLEYMCTVLASKESEQAPPPPPTAGELQQHGLFLSARGGGLFVRQDSDLTQNFASKQVCFCFSRSFGPNVRSALLHPCSNPYAIVLYRGCGGIQYTLAHVLRNNLYVLCTMYIYYDV